MSERGSFEHLLSWLGDVRDQAEEGATIALVGNMADLPEERRKVTHDEGAAFAHEHGLLFFETSAKTGENVRQVFAQVAQHIYERYQAQGTPSSQGPQRISLDAGPLQGGCCL